MKHMVTDSRIERALFYIENNLKRDIQLADMADAAGMSKHHFHRLFVKTTGETPARCVARQKIHRAAHDLLIISDAQVIDIAFEYGFSSPAVFTRTFSKLMGKSPTRFRRERLAELGWDQRKRLDRARKKIPARKSIPLRYFPRQIIAVKRCSLDPYDLNATYQGLIAEKPGEVTHAVGIYVEPPSGRLSERAHYVGLDRPAGNEKYGNVFEIPGGYYSFYAVSGDFAVQRQKMIAHLESVIDPSAYEVASTLYFERVPLDLSTSPFDFFATERMVYVMVCRK